MASEGRGMKKKKILIVDSEIQILHVISMKLREGDYKVLATQDGLDALDLAQVERPDLIISACRIYRLSGLELCKRLKLIPATHRIPKLLLTARGYALDAASVEAAGIDVVLNKPFSPRYLKEEVDEMLGTVSVASV
jgi:CheY-like chemotaxis protein